MLLTLCGVMPWSLLYASCRGAAAVGFVHGSFHALGEHVAVEDDAAVHIARRAADGLDERGFAAQKTLLVRVQNRHKADLRHVQSLAQQVDAHQHVELTQPQIANELGALHGLNVGMQVTHADAQVFQVIRQAFGHALGQRGHQHAAAFFRGTVDLPHQIVHLTRRGPKHDQRVNQPRGDG